MTQIEFARKMAEAQNRASRARKDIITLRKQYIKEDAPYKIGDKVQVITRFNGHNQEETIEYGFIKEIHVRDDGTFTVDLNAVKKDGTEYKNKRVYVRWYLNPILTVIEP